MWGRPEAGPTSHLEPLHVDALAPELPRLAVPGEEDDHGELDELAGRCLPAPLAGVRPGDLRLLADALRPDDDVREVEPDVGKGGQELRVEARRALVPLPPFARLYELVDAVLGQRGDEAREVA